MDNLSIDQRKKNMRNIRSKNTKPEILLRIAIHKLGIRYRIHEKDIVGKPDICIKKYKLAIFVDSDFWHGRLYLNGTSKPKTNELYWISKLERNIQRDKFVNETLLSKGWHVLRYWESDIKKNVNEIASNIQVFINSLKNKNKVSFAN